MATRIPMIMNARLTRSVWLTNEISPCVVSHLRQFRGPYGKNSLA